MSGRGERVPAGEDLLRSLCHLGLLAALACGFPAAHAACRTDTPGLSIAACEATYQQEVRKRLGEVGIVLTPEEESNLMALQRDQWAEAKASTRWEPAGDDRRPQSSRITDAKHPAGSVRSVRPNWDLK